MAFFGKKDFASNVQNLPEIYRLNSQISGEEKTVNSVYIQIGKLYVKEHGGDNEPAFAELVASAAASEERISGYKDQVLELKGLRRCECGAEVAKDMVFCPSCGVKLPPIVKNEWKCASCGAAVPKDTNFCPTCGSKIVPPAEQKKCPFCGQSVVEGNRFCTGCGKEVTQVPVETPAPVEAPKAEVCSVCGAEIEEGNGFCTVCGAKVEDAPQRESLPADEPTCPGCGARILPGNGFCTECGTKV